MRKITFIAILSLVAAFTACSASRDGLTLQERIAADKNWYCGPGLFGLRAVGRFGLGLLGVPIPDLCKAVDAIIQDAESETVEVER